MFGFPFGTDQTLIFDEGGADEITVELSADDFEYAATARTGDGYLGFLGYDRTLIPDYAATTSISARGTSFWTGANLQPYSFQWQLRRLSAEKYFSLWAMFWRQQETKEPVLLIDERLAMEEPTPRARAKKGTVSDAPTIPGMTYFWPIFQVQLIFPAGESRELWKEGLYNLDFSATEILPILGTSEDRA